MALDLPVILSMLTMDDADAHLAGEDEELVRWLSGGPGTVATVRAYLERSVEWWQAGGPTFAFGVRAGEPAVLAGTVEVQFDQLELQPGHINISYGIYPPWRGRGVASRAVGLACEFAQARGARQAVIRAEPLNLPSVAVARRCGFSYLQTSDDGTELQWWVRDLARPNSVPSNLTLNGLVLLVGPPGAGKSSLARRLIADGYIDEPGIVQADKLKVQMFPRITDSDIRDPAVFAEIDLQVRDRLAARQPVVVDATNVRAAARLRLITIARALGRSVTAIRFTTDLPTVLIRNAARGSRLPDAIVREYAELMRTEATEDQMRAEGVDTIVTIA